jgi:ribose 5-phosphate isomerase RpiB
MKISIGNDHAGQIIKKQLKCLKQKGTVTNYGTDW